MIAEFSIWIASKSKLAHLSKEIELNVLPRVGEFIKFKNDEVGDYFAWEIRQITYHELGRIEIWTELLNNHDNCGYSFEDEEDFQELEMGEEDI